MCNVLNVLYNIKHSFNPIFNRSRYSQKWKKKFFLKITLKNATFNFSRIYLHVISNPEFIFIFSKKKNVIIFFSEGSMNVLFTYNDTLHKRVWITFIHKEKDISYYIF